MHCLMYPAVYTYTVRKHTSALSASVCLMQGNLFIICILLCLQAHFSQKKHCHNKIIADIVMYFDKIVYIIHRRALGCNQITAMHKGGKQILI